MRKATLYIVRHAQGYHNLCKENEQLPDPDLTDFGKKQCADLRANFPSHDKLTHLVASPLRRTIHTCLESFAPSDDDPKRTILLPVIALPEIQEVSEEPCDTGSDVAKLEHEFRGKVDFSHFPAGWNDKSSNSPWEPTVRKLDVRARKARVALREMARAANEEKDVCIIVVTHGEFLGFLTDDWSGIHPPEEGLGFTATSWVNCEYRSYEFVQGIGSEDDEAAIRETEESWYSRRGDEKIPTAEEQADLRSIYIREFGWFIKDDTLPN